MEPIQGISILIISALVGGVAGGLVVLWLNQRRRHH
jgi:hypothetical protein